MCCDGRNEKCVSQQKVRGLWELTLRRTCEGALETDLEDSEYDLWERNERW